MISGNPVNSNQLNVTLDGVVVTDNVAKNAGGGGIYASYANLTLANSIVAENMADNATYDPLYGGGGLLVDDGHGGVQVTLTASTVGGNRAPNNAGGGIRIIHRAARRTASVTLTGSTVSGNQAQRGGGIATEQSTLALDSSTIAANQANVGGGILNVNGALTVTASTISANGATEEGGGLYTDGGTANVTNSTISGNQATLGGGLFAARGPLALAHVTLTGNRAGDTGGGIAYWLASVTARASLVLGNAAGSGPYPDCWSVSGALTLTSQGGNLFGDGDGCPVGERTAVAAGTILDPALAANGGPTKTHALVPGSPAIDRVPAAACVAAADQRGVARPQGPGCDSGAVARTPAGGGSGPYGYAPGTAVTLAPQPAAGYTFVGWVVDGVDKGWASPLGMTMDADHSVQATFAPVVGFPDVPGSRADHAAIVALASRGTIRGYNPQRYGPDDGVQRAQMAALIARATAAGPHTPPTTLAPPACLIAGTWDCEAWGTAFTDRSGDPNLWRNAGTLQHYGVALGYTAADCAAKRHSFPCYGPSDPVTYTQTITFIVRMMKVKGYWIVQPGTPLPHAGVPGPHQEDVRTFAFYAGGIPAPPANWNAGATRGWFALALWAALNSYWGTDGTLPDGRPAGGLVP